MRRVVTGHSPQGSAAVASDGEPSRVARFESRPGFELTLLWATEGVPDVPGPAGDPAQTAWPFVPGSGATRFGIACFPSPGLPVDGHAFLRELSAKAPGLAGERDPANPGMHATETVDYVVVVSGELELALDGGETTKLRAGDCVVQNGTRHAWRNIGPEPAIMVFVMIGARRTPVP
jgi:mannose-6-phosphate isomerase-like protein (cupin superfamily)